MHKYEKQVIQKNYLTMLNVSILGASSGIMVSNLELQTFMGECYWVYLVPHLRKKD